MQCERLDASLSACEAVWRSHPRHELRNAADADHHYRVIEGFGCKHAFHTIIAPLKTKEFYAAREKDHQFPILGQGHSQSLAKMVY